MSENNLIEKIINIKKTYKEKDGKENFLKKISLKLEKQTLNRNKIPIKRFIVKNSSKNLNQIKMFINKKIIRYIV